MTPSPQQRSSMQRASVLWRWLACALLMAALLLPAAPLCAQGMPMHASAAAGTAMKSACSDPCCAHMGHRKPAPAPRSACVEHCVAPALPESAGMPGVPVSIAMPVVDHTPVPLARSRAVEAKSALPPPLLPGAFLQPLRI